LADVIRKLGRDPEFLKSLTDRAKQGRLSPAEARLVMDTLKIQPVKKDDGELQAWEALILVLDEDERTTFAEWLRRAIKYRAERRGDAKEVRVLREGSRSTATRWAEEGLEESEEPGHPTSVLSATARSDGTSNARDRGSRWSGYASG